MKVITMSTALYGCESWILSADTERRLQAFEFRFLRRILQFPYTAYQTNESVWAKIMESAGPQPHLLADVKKRKMQWSCESVM